MIETTAILWFVLGVALLALVPSMIVITSQQHVKIVETFGKFSSVRGAGLSLKLPWPIQTASSNFSLKIMEIAEEVTVKSSDNAFVTVPIRVQYRVSDNGAEQAFYKLDDPESQIRSYVVNQVRSTASGLTFDELFRSRDNFEEDVESTLKERMTSFGFRIENVLVDDPQPSQQLREAFDRVIASQRLKEAAENEGEAARRLAVAKANAEGQSLEIKGAAWSQFRKTIAEGNAEALENFVGTTGLSPAEALVFFTSVNEMEAVRDAASDGGRVVFVAGSAARGGSDSALIGMMAEALPEDARGRPRDRTPDGPHRRASNGG